MGLEFNDQPEGMTEKLRRADWKKIGLHHALPVVVAFVVGGLVFGSVGDKQQTYSREKILSDVDLPSQVAKLQDSQLSVLESTLKKLDQTAKVDETGYHSREDRASLVLATLNHDNNLTGFFKTLLAFDPNSTAESQYSSLASFLENPLTSTTTNSEAAELEKAGIMAFLNAQSWAKETGGRVSLAGSVIPALLTGSTDDSKLYLVVVPATNEKREFRNLSFVVGLGKQNKVSRIVYQGEIDNNADIEAWYKGFEAVLNGEATDFIYQQQVSQEERQKQENEAFLERVKTAFGLKKTGDRKQVRLDGQKLVVSDVKQPSLDQLLKSEYKLTDEQIKKILQSINEIKKDKGQ